MFHDTSSKSKAEQKFSGKAIIKSRCEQISYSRRGPKDDSNTRRIFVLGALFGAAAAIVSYVLLSSEKVLTLRSTKNQSPV